MHFPHKSTYPGINLLCRKITTQQYSLGAILGAGENGWASCLPAAH